MKTHKSAKHTPLPLRLSSTPRSVAARAAKLTQDERAVKDADPYKGTAIGSPNTDAAVVDEYGITRRALEQVYMSPHPYHAAFEEDMSLVYFAKYDKPSGGMKFVTAGKRLILQHMEKSSPGARIPRWRSRLKQAWLISINEIKVSTVEEVTRVLARLVADGHKFCTLLFAHPEVKHGLTNTGIPQVNLDQVNPRRMFGDFDLPGDSILGPQAEYRFEGGVVNLVTNALKLTRKRLLTQPDWKDWQSSEWTQLDQYEAQGMFGAPVKVASKESVFNLVWTYMVKELDQRKKARCTCDGSTRSGQVRVLDYTYANCVDHTSSRLFYAASAAENMLIYGADVSNAFGEAPAPKQGFHIRPDQAIREWWISKGRDPIPDGYVLPVLAAMQGHPESPRLWEKHADKILRECGLTPTQHEPCLYSGVVNGERVLFKRQVDDFELAAPTERTANILFDMIDDRLTFPLKRMGLVSLFNGLDVLQTRDYVKISVKTYIERIAEKHLQEWMTLKDFPARSTPLPTKQHFIRDFLSTAGDPDAKVQEALAKKMGFRYRSGIGELIYAMITCRPDLSYGVVRASQFSVNPAEIHYNGVRHMLKYLYATRDDGIIFWRETPNEALPAVDPPTINSNMHDLLLDGRPTHDPLSLHAFMDSAWADCPITRRSGGGECLRLAGGTVAYKSRLQPTVSQSSTEAEFIEASDAGKLCLFVRSVMWDLGIPQCSATVAYEDNDACTAMANAQKPTSRTRHMDVKYNVLCEWVERDLIVLERVDTKLNLADHFTKQLGPLLFHRHVDYIMGRVPPQYSPCFAEMTGLRRKEPAQAVKTPAMPGPMPLVSVSPTKEAGPLAAAAARLVASWSRVTAHYVATLMV